MSKVDKLQGDKEELIISRIGNGFRLAFVVSWICLIAAACVSLYLSIDYGMTIIFVVILIYWNRLRIPANFREVKIRREKDLLYVNKKRFVQEHLLFLSFNETEGYRIIRLEARRKNILFPNEARILSNCSGLEEAVQLCREIRDFIDPGLKINHIRLVSGKSKYTRRGSRKIDFEHWEFIQ